MTLGTPLESLRPNKISLAIRAGLSVFAAGAFTFNNVALAQDVESEDDRFTGDEEEAILEEVIVTGFPGSLRTSQAIKENSDVVVDSITADDMGALPDRSVTEALQRVPGVSINRFAAGRDPDHFSVEGSNLIVRGLTYVKSEINGRDAFTANNGRGLNFSDISPELLAGVDVYKTLAASQIEGGIAGTINLRTRKPFDAESNVFNFSVEGTYSDFVEETTPTVSGLASFRWDSNAGEFGFLVSGVYSQIKSRSDRFQVSNFAERTLYSSGDVVDSGGGETPVKDVYFPRGAVMGTQEFDKKRQGYSAAFQWRSPDESLEATAEFLRSDSREAWTEQTVEIATDNVASNGDSRAVPGTSFTFDESDIFDSGYITGPSGWRDDQWSGDPRTPVFGLQSNNINRAVEQKYVTDDLSLNLKWFVNDEWAVNFDYQHVSSTVENLDTGLWTSSFQNARIDLNGTDLPSVQFTAPILCTGPTTNECPTYMQNGHPRFDDPYNSFYRSAMDHIEDSDGTSDAYRVDISKEFTNNDWVNGIQFGYRYNDRDQTARFSTYNWGSLSEIWGNGGPVWLDDPIDSNGGQPLDGYEAFYFDNFFNGKVENPLGDDGRLIYSGNGSLDYAAYAAYGKAIAAQWGGGDWVPLPERPGLLANSWFLPGEINPVREKNNAAYFSFKLDHTFENGWDFLANIGVRYSDTKRTSSGYQVFSQQTFTTEEECNAPLPPGEERSAWCSLDPSVRADARAYSDGTLAATEQTLDYDFWLPTVNLMLRPREGLQFRASYFKGVAPPDFGLTRNFYNINLQTNAEDIEAGGGRPIGRFDAGNPLLRPVEADNWDATVEWYFADVGQLTFAMFYKSLKNIRTNDIQRQTFTNNGATFDAIVTTAVNSEEKGKIKGFEIAYQQQYNFGDGWLSGFGVNANYTYVDSSNVPQSTLSETDPDVAAGNQSTVDTSLLPLEGLSKHTINVQPFYEYGRFSARLAYSWRSEFLLTVRDVIVPFQPIMNESTGQLDASIGFDINDRFSLGFQGVNLTQEVIRTTAVLNDDLLRAPRSWFLSDRRYTLLLRGRF